MTDQRRILIVDDEPQITRVLRRSLSGHGYDVQVAADGEEAIATFNSWKPDIVVTDLAMPNMGGLELCRRLRAISSVPLIVLSAKGDERIKVEALDAGADDYVTKPFGMDELLARIRVGLRRPNLSNDNLTEIEAGDVHVNLETRRVTVGGKEVHLTPKEFDLLVFMVRHPNKVLTHRALLAAVWGGDYVEQSEYLRVFVGHLRKKVEPDPSKPRYIITEPWTGYRFQT
jgi:two-component system, OmpR family, KDP operon response regulator KdpE